ncbi:MAG: hypothetical protein AABY27_01595 [Pseudomonadota bacterium]
MFVLFSLTLSASALTASNSVTLSATINEILTFNLGSSTLNLGVLSTNAASSGSHTMTLLTNSLTGAVVTYSGTTLTSGTNSVTGLATASDSTIDTPQFGLNLVASPCTGTGTIATAATGYSTAGKFKFTTGDAVLSSTGPINTTTCTASYVANIAGTTAVGSYSTVLTYTASSGV